MWWFKVEESKEIRAMMRRLKRRSVSDWLGGGCYWTAPGIRTDIAWVRACKGPKMPSWPAFFQVLGGESLRWHEPVLLASDSLRALYLILGCRQSHK